MKNLNLTDQILRRISPFRVGRLPVLIFMCLSLFLFTKESKALPSFARQTGLSCKACHYSFPELNSFGRQFKMNGYVLTSMNTIDSKEDSSKMPRLKLLSTLPISAMVQSSFTHLEKDMPGIQNNSVTLPQQLSVFYAGQVTPHIGTFIQMAYNGHSFGMGNIDIRYANQAKIGKRNFTYGLTLNNNPTVQDVWNSSPVWRFPFAGSDAAKNPTKSAIIENLGTKVAGLGAYTLFNNFLFAEATVYRSAQQGATNPADVFSSDVISGVAPYWRLALQHQWGKNYLELGTFGFAPKLYVTGIQGALDKYTDLGIDAQFEHNLSFGAFTAHSSLIKESETKERIILPNQKFDFTSLRVDGNLYLKNGIGGTLGYFYTIGSVDPRIGSWTNKPDSKGYIAQIEYLPWYNTKFALQYVAYKQFDGTVTNYNMHERSAANNSTIYLFVWLNF